MQYCLFSLLVLIHSSLNSFQIHPLPPATSSQLSPHLNVYIFHTICAVPVVTGVGLVNGVPSEGTI